jgi:hypothetical protein
LNPYKKNPWMPPWFSEEQTQAWKEMPTWNGKIAPFTQEFREEWRVWARKWWKKYPHPVMEETYKEMDRLKEKASAEKQLGIRHHNISVSRP